MDNDGLLKVCDHFVGEISCYHPRKPSHCYLTSTLLSLKFKQQRHNLLEVFKISLIVDNRITRLVSSIVQKCVKCRNLRCKHQFQETSSLPQNRAKIAPPFTLLFLGRLSHVAPEEDWLTATDG